MPDSSPHLSPRAAEHARELLAFEGEPKVIGQWFASARSMARDYLDAVERVASLEEQLDATQSELTEWRTSIATEALRNRIRELETAIGECDGTCGFAVSYPASEPTEALLTEEGGVKESSSGSYGQQMSPLRTDANDRVSGLSASTSPPAVSNASFQDRAPAREPDIPIRHRPQDDLTDEERREVERKLERLISNPAVPASVADQSPRGEESVNQGGASLSPGHAPPASSPATKVCDREGCTNLITGYDAWGQWCEEHNGGLEPDPASEPDIPNRQRPQNDWTDEQREKANRELERRLSNYVHPASRSDDD